MGKKNSKQEMKKMTADIDQLHLQTDVSASDDDNLIGKVDLLEPGSLGVFPEELWEAILNRVKCSKDIQNVFLAFPELDRIFHKKKSNWLFGLVLPHLIPKHLTMKMLNGLSVPQKSTQSNDLMNLRLVSKRWKNNVDRALYYSNRPSDEQTCQLNENHFNFMQMSDYHLGMTIFRTEEQVHKFMQDMAHHKGNPFPGKSVWIRATNPFGRNTENLIIKCVDLFEKFGKHVDVLDMEFYYRKSKCHFTICKNILKCLSNLPNLKSVVFKGQHQGPQEDVDDYFRTDVKTNQKLYPELLKLESFVWQVLKTDSSTKSAWTIGMIKAYAKGDKLTKLGIDEDLYCNVVQASSLVNLTELNLFLNDGFGNRILKLQKILRSLPNRGQHLKRFGLRQLKPCKMDVKIRVYELIRILAGFQIENLVLEDLYLEDETQHFVGKPKVKFCPAETITSIFVEDNLDLHYAFLKALPNLRFLTVHENNNFRANAGIGFDGGIYDEDILARKLNKTILKLSKTDLLTFWEKLPKLEMIRGSVDVSLPFGRCNFHPGFNLDVQYVRELGNKMFYGNMPR